jgi:PEP-CTERM motif
MKKLLLSLALAAGLTSFAGTAKGYYSLVNTEAPPGSTTNGEPAAPPTWEVAFYYYPIALGDIVTFYGTNVQINYAEQTTYNATGTEISGVWSSVENVTSNSFDITCLESSSGSVQFCGVTAPFTGYTVTVPSSSSDAAQVAAPAAAPEPSTYLLFGVGTVGLLMVLRRKKQTA